MSVTGMEILVGAGAVAGKEALKKAVESIYDAASDKAKRYLTVC
jgi:hypothetical protein